METFGNLLRQLLNTPMVFFDYNITFGQFFFFICLAGIIVHFIQGLFD